MSLRLDANGYWYHDGTRLHHKRMVALLHRSIARDEEGELVVSTGRDVLKFQCDDAPFFVENIEVIEDRVALALSDGTREDLQEQTIYFCEDFRFRIRIKNDAYWALVKRGAHEFLQNQLSLTDTDSIDGSEPEVIRLTGGHRVFLRTPQSPQK